MQKERIRKKVKLANTNDAKFVFLFKYARSEILEEHECVAIINLLNEKKIEFQ